MAEGKIPPFTKRKTPPFTEWRKELKKVYVNLNRKLHLVRIHAECLIGVLKKKIYPFSKYTNFPHT